MALDIRNQSSDFDPRSSAEVSPEASDSKSGSNRSKASIRVSLACVQCRSKHVKCDATQPACGRCLVEGKPCYYARSRRGIRDPKKRSLISDKPPVPPLLQHVDTERHAAPISLSFDISENLPSGWTAPRPADANESLVDAFFNHFYPGHPILPPKGYFLKYVEADPNSYQFLLSVLELCGALYTGHSRLSDLQEAAYSAACAPLPFTIQSVQGLHILAIIAFGETKFSHHIGFASRSWAMAIELRIHRKSFVSHTSDPVWAESCRRTWWYIRLQSMIRRISDIEPMVDDFDIESDADVPCSEEWEYQSGNIPAPISLSQYERAIQLGRSDFPSLAFQIEMSRTHTDVAVLFEKDEDEDVDRLEIINQADAKICDLLRRIPRWKMDVVDPDGRPDQILFGAMALAHISRIRLRQSALRKGLNLREYFPLGPDRGPDYKGQAVKHYGWNLHSIDIQAANSVCDMFRYPFPVKCLRPMMVPGLLKVAIVYLDACVFLGQDSPIFRERLSALIRILTIHGETWPLSKKIAEDIQAVVDEYLTPGMQPGNRPTEWSIITTNAISSDTSAVSSVMGFDSYLFSDPHLNGVLLDYHEPEQAMSAIVSTW